MTTAAQLKKQKRARRPIYLVVQRLVDPATGAEVGALVPANGIDQRLMRERKFGVGKEIRAELKQSRDAWKHRLIHKIGGLMVDNVDGWEHLGSHDAVKRLQRESGVCCEEIEIDTPGMGKLLAKQAESLAFDEMDTERFELLFNGITQHIGDNYAHVLLDEVRAEFWDMAKASAT